MKPTLVSLLFSVSQPGGEPFSTPSMLYIFINLLSIGEIQEHCVIPDHGHEPQNGQKLCRPIRIQQLTSIAEIVRDRIQLGARALTSSEVGSVTWKIVFIFHE